MTHYELIVGLEVHAELLTRSKMFCGCRVVDSVTAAPNTAVCPVCLGMPGMLPVVNRQAVTFAMRVALALNCTVQHHNIFARKNYFYPDLPKGFQISQYELPLATNGWLDITLDSGTRQRVGIRRVHMEEDTGKNTHLPDGTSLVDFNRSGVPLLEIVSEPDLRSPEAVYAYGLKLRQLLRYLGVNSGDMEKGVLRVEPNISVRRAGSAEFGTRTEIKNLNSFRALASATAYEYERQVAILEAGEQVIQETRGWDESRRATFSQRIKEEADDYRYFPEPDLPALDISEEWIDAVSASLPELPDAKLARYTAQLGLSDYEASVLTEERPVADWYEAVVDAGADPKQAANWVINQLFSLMNELKVSVDQLRLHPQQLVELISEVEAGTINQNTGKEVLAEMFATGRSAGDIIRQRGLAQISDEDALNRVIAGILSDNPAQVAAFLSGKTQLQGWFVGQVMRLTEGKANPGLAGQLLAQQLADLARK